LRRDYFTAQLCGALSAAACPLPCLPGLFFSISSASIKRTGDICKTPLSGVQKAPVTAETCDPRGIGTISVPVLPLPDQSHPRLTGWIDTLSQQYAPAIGAITVAIMAGGAVGIIITLFDPARRDAIQELWRQITVWLIGS
jgi:hypothetical protein